MKNLVIKDLLEKDKVYVDDVIKVYYQLYERDINKKFPEVLQALQNFALKYVSVGYKVGTYYGPGWEEGKDQIQPDPSYPTKTDIKSREVRTELQEILREHPALYYTPDSDPYSIRLIKECGHDKVFNAHEISRVFGIDYELIDRVVEDLIDTLLLDPSIYYLEIDLIKPENLLHYIHGFNTEVFNYKLLDTIFKYLD